MHVLIRVCGLHVIHGSNLQTVMLQRCACMVRRASHIDWYRNMSSEGLTPPTVVGSK